MILIQSRWGREDRLLRLLLVSGNGRSGPLAARPPFRGKVEAAPRPAFPLFRRRGQVNAVGHDLEDMIRVRADRGGGESVMWWTGDVYTWMPGAGPHHLFGFEGVNVSRVVPVEGGYELLT